MLHCSNGSSRAVFAIAMVAIILPEIVAAEPLPDNNTCDLCVKVVRELQELMSDPTSQTRIIERLEQICESFHSVMCRVLVDYYVPGIIAEFVAEEPMIMCENYHFC